MNHRTLLTLVAALLVSGAAATAGPAVADRAAAPETASRASTRSVTISAPRDVTEGDRYTVTAKVSAASKARTIQWQSLQPYYTGELVWTALRTNKIRGAAAQTYKALADTSSTQQYRAVVTYADGQSVTSHRTTVRLWHWIDLGSYTAYYRVGVVFDSPYVSFAMNGDTWEGWYVHNGMGESRYTLGRNCTAFRGTIGVGDFTDDGGTAQITLLTDETNIVYTSPTLVPGQVTQVQLDLDKPYRFSIQGRDTTPEDGITRDVYPAIGAPQFLCHFS